MGKVTDPYWLAVFRPKNTEISVTSLPHTRREKESIEDALMRLCGSREFLEGLRTYAEGVRPIEDADEIHIYKVGDGGRKSPLVRSIEEIRRAHDADLSTFNQ